MQFYSIHYHWNILEKFEKLKTNFTEHYSGETCLPSSSAVPNGQLSEGQRSSTQYDPYKNDQSVYIQQWQYSKYRETTSSSQQPSPVVIPSPSTGTRVGLADSFSKSSHTDYFRDIDPCSNCSNLLIRAAEFLTKIELNYERPTTVPSNLSTSTQYTLSIDHRKTQDRLPGAL
ncbi:hypothetical protein ACH3XW_26695 [Acanthocheilonema viteae]|uniref:Uncharacterized protein n=1 Tax=Acanthocheilonema viteae TaxID=6277 RepID=A0A498S6E6_ACAVI|nr:unnamed protein product [Acanthocheilonema viteae]